MLNLLRKEYINRYGDKFIFEQVDENTIKWEGNFEYCRIGWPNNYQAAYEKYLELGGELSLEDFKEGVHKYDEETSSYKINSEIRKLVTSDTSTLDMVDPSGGPYIVVGMEWMGKTVQAIEYKEGNYYLKVI